MFKRSAALILITGILSLTLAGCKGSSAAEEIRLPIYGEAEVNFEVATAQIMDISETQSMGAVIGYPNPDVLYYPAASQIVSYSAIKGKSVAEGDILAEINSADLDYEINNQQTVVNAAYGRASSSETARLTYEIEKYTLDMLLAEKERYIIRAPYDGIITDTNRGNVGDEVEAGDVCCTIAPEDRVEVYIDGGDASKLRFGQQVKVRIDGTDYAAEVVQAPDVAPASASNNAARRAVFRLEDGVMDRLREENEMAIAAGWATIFATTERKNVLAVPDAAVKTSGSFSYVTMVDGEERYRLNVTVGQSLGGYTEILNGIAEGDLVMADGSGLFTSNLNRDDDGDDNNGGDWGGEWNGDWNGEWNGDWGTPPPKIK